MKQKGLALTLVHKTTGEEREVFLESALANAVLVVRWPGAGDYALRLSQNELYGYGPGFGIRRTRTGWGAKDLDHAWEVWHEEQDEQRRLVPVRTRAARALAQKYPRKRVGS